MSDCNFFQTTCRNYTLSRPFVLARPPPRIFYQGDFLSEKRDFNRRPRPVSSCGMRFALRLGDPSRDGIFRRCSGLLQIARVFNPVERSMGGTGLHVVRLGSNSFRHVKEALIYRIHSVAACRVESGCPLSLGVGLIPLTMGPLHPSSSNLCVTVSTRHSVKERLCRNTPSP